MHALSAPPRYRRDRRGACATVAVPALLRRRAAASSGQIWSSRGFGVPPVLLPAPSDDLGAARRLAADPLGRLPPDLPEGRADRLGHRLRSPASSSRSCVDRVPFLRRGLLPLGNLVAALPIIGIAPIMVMWFGFDWQSKAAVVVVMTFFPMLVNTVAGLAAAGAHASAT